MASSPFPCVLGSYKLTGFILQRHLLHKCYERTHQELTMFDCIGNYARQYLIRIWKRTAYDSESGKLFLSLRTEV